MKRAIIVLATVICGGLSASALGQTAIGNAFTYQGRLDSGSTAASGLYDFQFKLYDAVTGGTQIGSSFCADNVTVAADGTFTVQLDFGAVYGFYARYLQIDVRRDTGLTCGNLTGFTSLSPRQRLTPAPVATFARRANGLDAPNGGPLDAVYVDNSGSVGIGTALPQGKLDVRPVPGAYVRLDTTFGDLHFNGGTDGFFGLYNDAGAAGRTEFVSSSGVTLSIQNDGAIGMGALPVSGTRLKVAGTIEADELRFATPQTIYISVDEHGFTPVTGETIGDTGYGRSTSGSGPMAASVSLPQGMVVTGISWYVRDSSGSDLSLIFFRQTQPHDPSILVTYLKQIVSSGTPGVTTLTGTLNHTVDNNGATYYLMALPLVSGTGWDSGRISVQGVTIVGTIRNPR